MTHQDYYFISSLFPMTEIRSLPIFWWLIYQLSNTKPQTQFGLPGTAYSGLIVRNLLHGNTTCWHTLCSLYLDIELYSAGVESIKSCGFSARSCYISQIWYFFAVLVQCSLAIEKSPKIIKYRQISWKEPASRILHWPSANRGSSAESGCKILFISGKSSIFVSINLFKCLYCFSRIIFSKKYFLKKL